MPSCNPVIDFLSVIPTVCSTGLDVFPALLPLCQIINVVSVEHGNDCCTAVPKSCSPPAAKSQCTHTVWHLCIICLSVSNETLTSSLHKGYCVPLIALKEPWALTKRLVRLQLTAEGPSAPAPWRGKILSVSNVCTLSFSLSVIPSLSLILYASVSLGSKRCLILFLQAHVTWPQCFTRSLTKRTVSVNLSESVCDWFIHLGLNKCLYCDESPEP